MTTKTVKINSDLCEQAKNAPLPPGVILPDQYQWRIEYWLRKAMELAHEKPRRPTE